MGWSSVAWGLANISSYELTEWQVYDTLDPIGRERDDWRGALVASLLAEIYRDRKQRNKAYTIDDFMPKWGESENGDNRTVDEWTEQEQVTWLEMLNAAYGGKDLRK